jgi:acyl-CoA thioesterase
MTQVDRSIHPFDAGVDLTPVTEGLVRGTTTPLWANMVGPFGGITAAWFIRAIELQSDRHGDPTALTVNFVAPIADGVFDISLRAVRTNRTNQHWVAELSQDGEVKTTATAVYGVRRDTWSDTESVAPTAPAPADVTRTGLPDIIAWARNYDMRFVTGGAPTPGADETPSSETTLWVREDPARALDFAALASMSDIFYPRIYLRRGKPVPAGTISLTTYFHADTDQLAAQGDQYVLATAHANRFARGYFDQSAQLWGFDGGLLATSHQIVYFKD